MREGMLLVVWLSPKLHKLFLRSLFSIKILVTKNKLKGLLIKFQFSSNSLVPLMALV